MTCGPVGAVVLARPATEHSQHIALTGAASSLISPNIDRPLVAEPQARASTSGRDVSQSARGQVDSATLRLALSGGLAGAIAKSCTAPLARLTILYQVQAFGEQTGGVRHGAYVQQPRLSQALAYVVQHEGAASLWKGNLVTIIHRVPYSAMNFVAYEHTSQFLKQHMPKDADFTRRMVAGGFAGAVACTAAYPLDLVRTRLAAQTSSHYYSGIGQTLRQIVRDDGPRGLYRGLAATLATVIPNLAINFAIYESLRSRYVPTERGAAPSMAVSLGCGCATGFAAASLTFPLDVVRRRMQVQQIRGGSSSGGWVSYGQVVQQVLRDGGWRAFYSGIVPEYCKVVPGVAIAFCTYEKFKEYLGVQ